MSETETLSIELDDKADDLINLRGNVGLLSELDNEIERSEHVPENKHSQTKKTRKSKWWIDNLRRIGSILKPSAAKNVVEELVVCRICELRVGKSQLEHHLKSCSDLASSLDRLSMLNEYCRELALQGGIKDEYAYEIVNNLTSIEGTEGRKAVVKLAKLHYKLIKYSSNDKFYKRTRYLIDQKQKLAEKIQNLVPEIEDGIDSSSISSSSSSLIRSPSVKIISKRKGRMTSLLALILGRHKPVLPNRNPESLDDFQIIKRLNKGGFGGVYLVKKRNTNDLFAMKIMEKSEMIQKNMVANVLMERKILMLIRTLFVVRLFYAFQTRNQLILVLEWMPGGDLAWIMKRCGRISKDAARAVVAELVFGLGYLHENEIVHRDVKPNNILVDRDGHVKLTDFGLAETTVAMTGRIIGTPDYMAPEVILGKSQSSSLDWWAIGCVLFEMLVGAPPFIDATPEKIFARILAHERIDWDDLPPEVKVDAESRDLIDWLLKPKPADRPSQREIMNHAFFSGLDWRSIRTCSYQSPLKKHVQVDRNYNMDTALTDFPIYVNEAEPMTAPYQHMGNESIASIDYGNGGSSSRSSPLARSMNASVSSFDSFTNFRNYDLLADLTLQGDHGSSKERTSGV